MLKKIVCLCLSLFFLVGVASAQQFSEGKLTRNVLQTTGKIKQLNEIGVNLLGEGDFKEVVLKFDDKTYIVDGDTIRKKAIITNGTNYIFNIITKNKSRKIESYYPEYFVKLFPDMIDRKKFIESRDYFLAWWNKYCH